MYGALRMPLSCGILLQGLSRQPVTPLESRENEEPAQSVKTIRNKSF